jgi:hypothetical protein
MEITDANIHSIKKKIYQVYLSVRMNLLTAYAKLKTVHFIPFKNQWNILKNG